MIHVITRDNAHQHEHLLREMHRDRKRVFVDRFKWNVPVVNGDMEVDQFDTPDAVYLVIAGNDGRHLGSARLLPSMQPHILGDLFPELADAGVPKGPDVFEMTRMVYSPELTDMAALGQIRMLLRLAMVEYAVAAGIRHYSCIVRMEFLPTVLSAGWVAEPLGFPRDIDGESTTAVRIDVDQAALDAVRAKFRHFDPVLTLAQTGEVHKIAA